MLFYINQIAKQASGKHTAECQFLDKRCVMRMNLKYILIFKCILLFMLFRPVYRVGCLVLLFLYFSVFY